MIDFSTADVTSAFPDFRVGLVVCDGVNVLAVRSAAVEALVQGAEAAALDRLGEMALGEVPELRCWREAYKAFGVKKTSYRSSVERLVKAVQRGAGIARVNGLVDLYNAVSLECLMPVGADDLDRIAQPFGFRRAIGGESFVRLGGEADDSAKPGEVIYADAEKCLCRRWNWYQDARSAVGPGATRVVFTVQALAPNATSAAAATRRLADLLGAHCDARCTTAVADRNQPQLDL